MKSSLMASNATRVPVMRNRLWLLESVFAVWMDTSQSRQSRARSSEQKKNALFSCNSAFFLLRNPQNGRLQTLMLQVTKPHPQPFQCKTPKMSCNLSLTITLLDTIFLTSIRSPTLFGALLWCFVLQTLAALSNTKVPTCLAISLIISLTIISLTTVLLTSIHHSEGGGLCLHACLQAHGVKRMSFLLRYVNNNVFLPKLRFCPSRNTMPHHGSSVQQQLQSPHSTAIINFS